MKSIGSRSTKRWRYPRQRYMLSTVSLFHTKCCSSDSGTLICCVCIVVILRKRTNFDALIIGNNENKASLFAKSALSVGATTATSATSLVTTASGYTLTPLGLSIISNAPLIAFAFVQASGIFILAQIQLCLILKIIKKKTFRNWNNTSNIFRKTNT